MGFPRENNGENMREGRKHHAHRNGNEPQLVSQGSDDTDGNHWMPCPQINSGDQVRPSDHRMDQATIRHHIGNMSSSSATIVVVGAPTGATTSTTASDQHTSSRGASARQGGTDRDGNGGI